MNIYKITQLLKPIAVIVLAIIGYFQEIIFDKDISNAIFLIIVILELLMHFTLIKNGFVALWQMIKRKNKH